MKLTKPLLFLFFISLLFLLYALINKPHFGKSYGYVNLRGKVAYISFHRVYLIDTKNRFWRLYTYRFKQSIFVGDVLTVSGYAKGFKIYPENIEVNRNWFQNLRVKVHSFLKRKFLKAAKTKANKKLGSALLFGENWFSKSERRKLGHIGVYHLVVISGMHYALFLTFFFLFPLRFKLRYFFTLGFFTFFTLFVLFPKAPAYRAFTSVCIFLLAKILERPYNSLKALLLAFSVSLLLYPYWVSNVGFWLSYIASLALILYYGNKQPVENQFFHNFVGKFLGLEATLVVTTAIAPILVSSFHYFTLGSFLYSFPLTVLVQLYIFIATFNLLTLFFIQPALDIQEKLAELFELCLHKFPENVYFKTPQLPLELTIFLTLAVLVILYLPIRRKLILILATFLLEIFLLKTFSVA